MDFGDAPAEREFRLRLQSWVAEHNPGLPASSTDDDYWRGQAAWHQSLYDAGFFGVSWPVEVGGQGLPGVYDVILDEELAAAGAPPRPSVGYLVRGILEHGSDEVKRRFVPGIVSGRDRWCQGFSEPDAGSDLASLRTRADLQGDEYVVHGHKVWTSYSDDAEWCLLLARTDPDVPKHKGISYLLLAMNSEGVTVRPLVLMNGHEHFNEVFFEDVRVPKENLVGPLNEGWKVAMTTLMYERGGAGGGGHGAQVRRLVELARRVRIGERPAWDQEWVRQRLAQFAIECEAAKYTRLRTLTRRLKGLPPGPEGSVLKLCGSELGVRIAQFATELLGGHALLGDPSAAVPDAPRWQNRVLSSRQYTIAGGTSEIQRNIIGERVLGLPRG